jgi:hypothetical protein
MAAENPTWGEERIANELNLKLTIQVSPRTVGRYLLKDRPVRTPDPKQRWLTFVGNHAKVIVACDFFVVITAAFRTLYVFVVIEIGSRQILHQNVTAHPTAEWTLQQFREARVAVASQPLFAKAWPPFAPMLSDRLCQPAVADDEAAEIDPQRCCPEPGHRYVYASAID